MKVLFFAQSRQAAGCDSHQLKVEGVLTQIEFWTLLVSVFPDLASLQKTARLARKEKYLQDDEQIHSCDEIAVIPPVSGG